MNLFEKAARIKLRFNTPVGMASVEDLWDLPLTSNTRPNLDMIAITINAQLKECATESVVHKVNPETAILQLKLDIVKHVIDVKLKEIKENENEMARKSRREELLALKDEKRREKDREMSLEELDRKIAELT